METVLKYGIDISEHNGKIDWDIVKGSGLVDFAILRAGYGKGVPDKMFDYNASECKRVGIPIGVYWFSYAKNAEEAKKEAEFCLDDILPYKDNLVYPIAYDFEDDSVRNCSKAGITIVGKEFATSLALNFLNIIKEYEWSSAIYTNPAYMTRYFDMNRLTAHDLWLAQWPATPNPSIRPSSQPAIWQYSSTGSIPGIRGHVDLNVSYKLYDTCMVQPGILDQVWVKEAIEKAKSYGVSDGSRPEAFATRAEVMAMVSRGIDYVIKHRGG